MRIYQSVDVELTYQDFGSAWLCILRGKSEEVEQVANAFFNFGATNGEAEYGHGNVETTATFWSSERKMLHCLAEIKLNHFLNESTQGYKGYKGGLYPLCINAAKEQIEALKETREVFMEFGKSDDVHYYSNGRISAERPDEDFKDACINKGFDSEQLDSNLKCEVEDDNMFEHPAPLNATGGFDSLTKENWT